MFPRQNRIALVPRPLTSLFPQMLVLSSSAGSSAIAAPHNEKFSHLQIIQLVEAIPPSIPPVNDSDVDDDNDYYSDYYSSSSASSTPSSSSSSSSYCSSLDDQQDGTSLNPLSPETYSSTKRILAWRQDFDVQLQSTSSSSSPPSSRSSSSLKRKTNDQDDDYLHENHNLEHDNNNNIPHSHPRSHKRPRSLQSLGVHSCTACDASFMTKQRLKQHGMHGNANEACCVAVEYALE